MSILTKNPQQVNFNFSNNKILKFMKSRTFLLLFIGTIMMTPLFIGCSDDDKIVDNEIENKLISKVWTLESGYYDWLHQYDEEFRWLDDDCEEVPGNPQEYKDLWTSTRSYSFSDALAHYEQEYSTTLDQVFFNEAYGTVAGKEYEDALTIKRDINFNYEITIKNDGTYRTYITYNVCEDDYPQPDAPDTDLQYGRTYSGTFTYDDKWHWIENGAGLKSRIHFQDFPFQSMATDARFDENGNFSLNWISDFTFVNQSLDFIVEKLTGDELILVFSTSASGYSIEVDNEWEALTANGTTIDCEGNLMISTLNNEEYNLHWTNDGQ